MADFQSLSDILAREALTDIAENFFGARRDMDDQLERFEHLLAELRAKEDQASRSGCFLNSLLLKGWAVNDFYQAIGVAPEEFHSHSRCDLAKSFPGVPFAVTTRGKYAKLVFSAYEVFQKAVQAFLHGEYYRDPRTGKMKITAHYQQVLETAVSINARIHDLNSNMSPVCVLQYVKGLDPAVMDKEKIVGLAPAGEGCSIDDKLAFRPIDIESLEDMDRPDLPPAEEVRERIEAFCKGLYAGHKTEIKALLAAITET